MGHSTRRHLQVLGALTPACPTRVGREREARAVLDQVADLAAGESSRDVVSSLGCILLPADGMALFLFCAPNEAVVRTIGRRASVPFDRIVRSVHLRPSDRDPTQAESDPPGVPDFSIPVLNRSGESPADQTP